MADRILTSADMWGKIYFTAHRGSVDLVIDSSIRYAPGPITLTIAAAEDLLTNLHTNSKLARHIDEVRNRHENDA